MTMTIHIEPRTDYLYALYEGTFDYKTSLRYTEMLLEGCEKYHKNKALVDFRKLSGQMDDSERISYAEHAVGTYKAFLSAGRLPQCRFAWLGKKPLLDPKRLGEAVVVNRGMMLIATDEIGHAFEWLGVKQDIE